MMNLKQGFGITNPKPQTTELKYLHSKVCVILDSLPTQHVLRSASLLGLVAKIKV